MGNCCRVFVQLPIEQVTNLIGNHPAVIRFGGNPIRPAKESYFGFNKILPAQMKELEKFTEINFINDISAIADLLNVKGYAQDLDGYGIDHWFTI